MVATRDGGWHLGVAGVAINERANTVLLPQKEGALNAKTKRLVIHIPFGLLLVLGARLNWVLPVTATALFLFYERDEDHWLKDRAYLDVAGALYGMGLGILAWAAWKLLGG